MDVAKFFRNLEAMAGAIETGLKGLKDYLKQNSSTLNSDHRTGMVKVGPMDLAAPACRRNSCVSRRKVDFDSRSLLGM